MRRLIIVANRLPVGIERTEDGELTLVPSVGGVATGLSSLQDTHESRWVGWAGIDSDLLSSTEIEHIRDTLSDEHGCTPLFLSSEDIEGFYRGFSNRTIWPLFHHFTQFAEFDSDLWEAYERVNRIYCDAVIEMAHPGDTIWIHDYQLMLVPAMIRERMPEATVGWFLHIPFPSFEIFRMLPWRRQVLEGLLGADLIGFHTYDYARHFLNACRRLLSLEDQHGRILVDGRLVLVDAYPMGIDYARYRDGATEPDALAEAERIGIGTGQERVVLSIDRLDYTKGIPDRLRVFDAFLEQYPDWQGHVTLVCVAVPSREGVETYRQLKTEVDELVGSINGKYGTIDWIPIRYLYRSLPFETLCGMYGAADVALVTPLRDGMNLIAKEYLAAHDGGTGVLVLSEMAGAARELSEAIQVNPFDRNQVVEALHEALTMPQNEIRERNTLMQRRLMRYTVSKWAGEFLDGLEQLKELQGGLDAHLLNESRRGELITSYHAAQHRLILLDYDGTLTPFAQRPEDAVPSTAVLGLIERIAADSANDVVVISGRDRSTLEGWFGDLDVEIVAEHGVWLRERSAGWITIEPMSGEWKQRISPLLEMYVDRTPGSFIEEKEYSLVWHYRAVNAELAETRVTELKEALGSIVADLGLTLMDGNKVLEVKTSNINKGRAAHRWMCRDDLGFILAIGDDRTDEDIFDFAPDGAWTIKVGPGPTHARHSVRSVEDVRNLLHELTTDGEESDGQ